MKAFLFLNVLITTLIILRSLLKNKISRKMQYSLWVVIPMFILLVSIISIPVNKTVPNKAVQKIYRFPETAVSVTYGPEMQESVSMHASSEVAHNVAHSNTEVVSSASAVSHVRDTNQTTHKKVDIKRILLSVYLIGVVIVAAIVIRSNAMLMKRIKNSREYYDKSSYGNLNVYKLSKINSPFLLLNNIYIPDGMDKDMESYKYTECHEYCHFKQGDNFWNVCECVFLILLWFDPLIWAAYFLIKKDSEYAVDESVIRILGEDKRANYSQTLLDSAVSKSYKFGALVALMSSKNSFLKKRISNIMHGYKKNTAAILATIILLTSLVSCSLFTSNDTREEVLVSEDTPWYNCEETILGSEYADIDFNVGSMTCENIAKIDSGYVYAISGSIDDGTEYGQLLFDICLYSESGDLISKFDLRSYLDENLENYTTYLFQDDIFAIGNDIKIRLHSYEENSYKLYSVDFENNALKDCQELDSFDGWNWDWSLYATTIGDKTIYTGFAYDMSNDIKFLTAEPDGSYTLCSMKECLGNDAPRTAIFRPVPISNHELILIDTLNNNLYIFDIDTQMIRIANDELSWLAPYITVSTRYSYTDDGKMLLLTRNEICEVNFDNSSVDVTVLLENIDANRNDIASTTSPISIIYADSENITFVQKSDYSSPILGIYNATLADENPNVGKQIITTDGDSDLVYEAAYKFNSTDEDYFIRIIPYAYSYWYGLNDVPESEFDEALREARQQAGFQMQVDLVAGECPDIVFYVNDYPQVNKSNCMMDLTSFYDSSDLSGVLFDSIISASRTNDGLYAVPLTFTLHGLLVDRNRYENPGRTLSLDEYTEFMSSYLNGHNPIGSNQMNFFMEMVNNHYDLFTTEGCPNFDCDEFREIATYTYENIVNTRAYDNSHYPSCNTVFGAPHDWIDDSRSSFIDIKNTDMLGLPSIDGRQLAATSREYVSITNGTNSPEGAWRFICMLYDADVQSAALNQGMNFGIESPVNRIAFEQISSQNLDLINDYEEYSASVFNDPYNVITMDDISTFESFVDSVDHMIISNGDVEVILYEEMQAYFAGDKTLDEVIDIINSRVSLIYEEYN